jgi:hypothetical protein
MFTPTLKLFNAVQIPEKRINIPFNINVLNKTIQHGFILDPNIDSKNYVIDNIIHVIGVNGKHLNSSFHKSWKKVKYEKIENLVAEQLIHYFTTYGFESIGIFDSDKVFIPAEKLEVPEIKEDFSFLYIKGLTKEEILEKIIELGSGIALSQETLDYIMEIIDYNQYSSSFVKKIDNRELKSRLYEFYNIVPTEPEEYLRYVIYKITGRTLLIKNYDLIESIKVADYEKLNKLLKKAPDNLASIFFRYKPLFLAMKHVSKIGDGFNKYRPLADVLKKYKIDSNEIKPFINKLRKKANKQHKPLPPDYFNSISEQISKGQLNLDIFKTRLKNINIYRKIRLAYSLNYRIQDNESIVYKIRNGKSWATDLENIENRNLANKALQILKNSIINDISKNVEGKKIYIPEYINYSLPSTEKSFIGNIPSNSYVSLDKDMIVGVHWFNQKNAARVDLDLSLIGDVKIGWDRSYRSDDLKVLFSGDMTDAPRPNGASELFYIKKAEENPWVLNLNNYTYRMYNGNDVPFKFFIANKKLQQLNKNYMVDPNDIVLQTEMTIKEHQQVLGLIINFAENDNRFYFSNFSSGNSITSTINEVSNHIKNYLIGNTINNTIDMKEILLQAKAILTDSKSDCDIDLSPESIDKTTIINILK